MKMHWGIMCCLFPVLVGGQSAFNDYEDPPHDYWGVEPMDAASQLHRRMTAGEIRLPAGDELKFLQAYLRELRIAEASQVMVFSKTAFQRQIVHAGNPRAIYFNDDVSVGYIPGGKIEVAGVDPKLGGIFYIFDIPKEDGSLPKFERPRRCLGCHAGSFTNFLPGLMTNSVFTQADGRVIGSATPHFSGHAAPLVDRWGGWLVTGEAQGVLHQGNLLSTPSPDGMISEAFGALNRRFDPQRYLHGTRSDVAALLVLDHLIGGVNRLMEAQYRVRTAVHSHRPGLADDDSYLLEGEAMDVAREQVALVVRYLLFAEEAHLPSSAVAPDPEFAAAYREGAPSDAEGRSLRDLSLQGRLFRHRCSPLVHSGAFRGLPAPFRTLIWEQLWAALGSDPPHPAGAHLPAAERAAIVSILGSAEPEFSAAAAKVSR